MCWYFDYHVLVICAYESLLNLHNLNDSSIDGGEDVLYMRVRSKHEGEEKD